MSTKNIVLRRLLWCLLLLGIATPCLAQGDVSITDKQFTADVLKVKLFAKTIEESQYCDYIIQKRDDGTLPARILYGVYQKAITKDRKQRFFYFKTALEILCKREGIVLNPEPVKTSPATTISFLPSTFRGLFHRN